MRIRLPEPLSWRRLRLAVAASLLLHVTLFALAFFVKGFSPLVIAQKGEPLFIELPKPEEEPAPQGNPALPIGPPAQPARPPAPRSRPPAKSVPRVETARPAPKAEPLPPEPTREPAPPQVAKAAPPPEPDGARAAAPTPVTAKEEASPEPSAPAAGETQVALAKPPSPEGGLGGGGLRGGGRGGIEGEPVPFDTKDPRYTDYFNQIRRRIRENWVYPREAGERGIGGQLVIEFAIRKDGWLQVVELKRSSGVPILDLYAMNALKLAMPFPPVPDSVSKGPLLIAGIFTYQIVDSGLLNQFIR